MNTNFFVDCRWYTTPCKTVLNADEFVVEFFTDKHSIVAKVSDKCYFLSIDNINLSAIKCDFHFSRKYTKPKEFLSKLYETLDSFISTSITFLSKLLGVKRPICKNTDEILDILFEELIAIDRETAETATDTETAETEDTTEKELENLEKELIEPEDNHIEVIKKFKEKADLNSSFGEATEPLTVYQFERLTRTLFKSLFKAIGIQETRKIPFIISNNMVFFNYNDTQYKYYPSQCKIFKKCGRKYQRINWKDFSDDNSPNDQKQALGRSPPLLLI